MTSALAMSDQSLMLHESEITESDKTESRPIVGTEMTVSWFTLEPQAKLFGVQTLVPTPGPISFLLLSPLASGGKGFDSLQVTDQL